MSEPLPVMPIVDLAWALVLGFILGVLLKLESLPDRFTLTIPFPWRNLQFTFRTCRQEPSPFRPQSPAIKAHPEEASVADTKSEEELPVEPPVEAKESPSDQDWSDQSGSDQLIFPLELDDGGSGKNDTGKLWQEHWTIQGPSSPQRLRVMTLRLPPRCEEDADDEESVKEAVDQQSDKEAIAQQSDKEAIDQQSEGEAVDQPAPPLSPKSTFKVLLAALATANPSDSPPTVTHEVEDVDEDPQEETNVPPTPSDTEKSEFLQAAIDELERFREEKEKFIDEEFRNVAFQPLSQPETGVSTAPSTPKTPSNAALGGPLATTNPSDLPPTVTHEVEDVDEQPQGETNVPSTPSDTEKHQLLQAAINELKWIREVQEVIDQHVQRVESQLQRVESQLQRVESQLPPRPEADVSTAPSNPKTPSNVALGGPLATTNPSNLPPPHTQPAPSAITNPSNLPLPNGAPPTTPNGWLQLGLDDTARATFNNTAFVVEQTENLDGLILKVNEEVPRVLQR